MKTGISRLAIVICLFIISQSNIQARDRGRVRIVNGTVMTDQGTLLRGRPFDFKDSWPAYTLNINNWKATRDLGLNCVRLIMRHDDETGKPMYNLSQIDQVVNYASQLGMYIVLDCHLHHKSAYYNGDTTRAFWKRIAPRYKDRTHVLYEALNEPGYSGGVVPQKELYRLIRGLAPNSHIIMYSHANGVHYSEVLAETSVIKYDNACVGYHLYGGSAQGARDFADKNNIPVLMTEYFLGASLITTHERLKISWIPWGRTSTGPTNEPPQHFMDAWKNIVAPALAKAGVSWKPDNYTATDVVGAPIQAVTIAPDAASMVPRRVMINGRLLGPAERISALLSLDRLGNGHYKGSISAAVR